jgi:hypothetical protein
VAEYFPGQDVAVGATFLDAAKNPVVLTTVSVSVTDPAGNSVVIKTAPAATAPGIYQAVATGGSVLGDYLVTWVGQADGYNNTLQYTYTVQDLGTTLDPLAVGVMVAYCGWDPTIPVDGVTEVLDGNGTPVLTLPSLYVTDVASVTVTSEDGTTTWTPTVGPGQQVGWSVNGVLTWNPQVWPYAAGCMYWPEGQQNISVVYSGGYNTVPADLNAALTNLTNRLPQMGRTSAKIGTAALTFAQTVADGGLLLVEQMVLDRYRLPRVA